MKLGIPVNDDQKTVCMSFGRTLLFAVWDTENDTAVYLDNSAAASQGGAGIKAAQMLVDNHVDAVLTPRLGENAAQVFQAAGIPLYKTEGESVADNIAAFKADKLEPLTDIHPGFHGHGGN